MTEMTAFDLNLKIPLILAVLIVSLNFMLSCVELEKFSNHWAWRRRGLLLWFLVRRIIM